MSSKKNTYEELFILFSKKVENYMIKTIVGLLSLLLIFQLMIQIPWVRLLFSEVYQLEGTEFSYTIEQIFLFAR